VIIWAELGDTRRFSASRHAVRHTGLDISVSSSTANAPAATRPPGPAAAALGAVCGRQVGSQAHLPDHAYDLQVAERAGANRATLSVAASWPGAVTTPARAR